MRSDTGGGHWEFREKLPERWVIGLNNLKFYVKPTGFKHTGLFPGAGGQLGLSCRSASAARAHGAVRRACSTSSPTPGGATLACAAAGAHVTRGRGQGHGVPGRAKTAT